MVENPLFSEKGMIDEDLLCQCGYNLRGIDLQGNCPECGEGVRFTHRRRRNVPHTFLARRRLFVCVALVNTSVWLASLASELVIRHLAHLESSLPIVVMRTSMVAAWMLVGIAIVWIVRSPDARESPVIHLLWLLQACLGSAIFAGF